MSDSSENATTRLAHVLFMDIVGYSKLPTDEQRQISTLLKQIVRATRPVSRASSEDDLISLYTGDGMALVFFETPFAPVECAVEIDAALKDQNDIKLRMGIHSGLVELIYDVNEKLNVAGGGINTAQRVMDCGDDGHILLSRRVADDLSQFRKWQAMLHDLGEARVKHDQSIHIVNLHSDTVGNPDLPLKFRENRDEKASRLRWIAIGAGFLILLAVAAFIFLRPAAEATDKSAASARPESAFTEILERKRGEWIDRIFSAQAPNGGIKASPSDKEITVQTWATAQFAVAVIESGLMTEDHVAKIRKAFDFMETKRRNSPSEGWNIYGSDIDPYAITEIGGWVAIAYIKSVESKTPVWPENERPAIITRIERDLAAIVKRQDGDGGFRPIMDEDPDFSRTYSTTMALWSLIEARKSETIYARIGNRHDESIRRAINWLMRTYREKQGWVQNPNRMGQTRRFDGLTAQTLFVLSHADAIDAFSYVRNEHTYKLAQTEFIASRQFAGFSIEKDNSSIPDGDVRFPGTEFVAEGSTFLWFPWVIIELAELSSDEALPAPMRTDAAKLRLDVLNANAGRLENYVEEGNFSYILAENLFCMSHYLGQMRGAK